MVELGLEGGRGWYRMGGSVTNCCWRFGIVTLKKAYPYYLANEAVLANRGLEVTDKWSGEVVARVALADGGVINKAIGAAVKAREGMASFPAWRRQRVLLHCVEVFERRAEELAEMLCVEAGKPIKDSRGEVGRLVDTFRIAAEEAVRLGGEVMALDRTERSENYVGYWRRVPVGVCSFIAPFNFPLNLAAHKVAPAIAAGCPFVLKPATRTPLGALAIGEALAETDLPAGAFSILPCRREDAERLTTDERVALLSFTGSDEVGWALKANAGKKKVVLELGGNAAVVVDEDADLEDAVGRVIVGAFYQSGQSCIGVQRVLVHRKVYERFKRRFVAATKALKCGNPRGEKTFVGPMISEGAAKGLKARIDEAVGEGARVLCGGGRRKALLQPTVLEGVSKRGALWNEEAFGPVALLAPFGSFEGALREVNRSRFGLQAGVFTRDIEKMHRAWEALEVGGVMINEVPSWRVDSMPYGGVKDSGLGREGVRWSIEDMTEVRLMVVRRG